MCRGAERWVADLLQLTEVERRMIIKYMLILMLVESLWSIHFHSNECTSVTVRARLLVDMAGYLQLDSTNAHVFLDSYNVQHRLASI